MIATASTNKTLMLPFGGCAHSFTVRLGCEPHAYEHTWGWACWKCGEQVFYEDLQSMCDIERMP